MFADIELCLYRFVPNSDYHQVAQENPHELSAAIQAGIPAQLRGLCWQLLSASKDEEMEIIYAFYIRQSSPHEKQIRKDLSRTFPEQDYFKDGKGIGQENLFNVVKAYSLYDTECGYCQGMGFVCSVLLLNMPDEEAFSTLVRLMKSYGLRGHFLPNMPGLQLRLFQFDRLLEDMLPLLHRHLTRQGIKASMYATQWFMTLFSYRFPLDLVYRILDSVFAEGIEAIFRFAMALMQRSEEALLELNFEQALAYLKGSSVFDVYKVNATPAADPPRYNVDAFAQEAYAVQITPYMLDGYAAEFEEQVKAANAHRREVEALRLVNRNLASRVASLEEQLQQINAEHVDLVKEAVMSKIAKEEMEEELVSSRAATLQRAAASSTEPNHHQSLTARSQFRLPTPACEPRRSRRSDTRCSSQRRASARTRPARVRAPPAPPRRMTQRRAGACLERAPHAGAMGQARRRRRWCRHRRKNKAQRRSAFRLPPVPWAVAVSFAFEMANCRQRRRHSRRWHKVWRLPPSAFRLPPPAFAFGRTVPSLSRSLELRPEFDRVGARRMLAWSQPQMKVQGSPSRSRNAESFPCASYRKGLRPDLRVWPLSGPRKRRSEAKSNHIAAALRVGTRTRAASLFPSFLPPWPAVLPLPHETKRRDAT